MKTILTQNQSNEPIPYDLLLLADPDLSNIKKYLADGQLYLAKNEEGTLIGACVIQELDAGESWEILNIAVEEGYHNQGIGQQIIQDIVVQARLQKITQLWVATANSSIGQLAFYQKCGFEMHSIVHNFFLENYPEPIVENGIRAKHQVRLRMGGFRE